MTAEHTVGIGLPVYNNERHLRRTLDSILAQSHSNIRLYLVDDNSTDGSADICKEYARRDNRIIFDHNESNLGEIGNYRKVLDMADTEFFMFARGHEILPPTLLSDCLGILLTDPDVALAFTRTEWIDEDDNPITSKHLPYSDTRDCDVVSRCSQVFWGKYEYFYGVTRTSTMKSIRALEAFVGTDLLMLFEMALVGSFAHSNSGIRYRRYYYNNESYKERIKRYQRILFDKLPLLDRFFPFARLPIALIQAAASSSHPLSTRLLLILVICFNAPVKYLSARGKTL